MTSSSGSEIDQQQKGEEPVDGELRGIPHAAGHGSLDVEHRQPAGLTKRQAWPRHLDDSGVDEQVDVPVLQRPAESPQRVPASAGAADDGHHLGTTRSTAATVSASPPSTEIPANSAERMTRLPGSVTHTPSTRRPVVRGAARMRAASSRTDRASPTSTAGWRQRPRSRAAARRRRSRCRPLTVAASMVGTATKSTPRENSSLNGERGERHDGDQGARLPAATARYSSLPPPMNRVHRPRVG